MFSSQRALLRGKQRYLLKDSFGKPLAAGALNATPATPGPGARTCDPATQDTESLLAINPWIGSASLASQATMSATFGAANNRCSYYAGQSWIGFAGADFGAIGLTAGKWYLVVMQDSTSKLAYGYIQGGNLGAGETLGSELATSWTNWTGSLFETFDSTGTAIASAINTAGDGYARTNVLSTVTGKQFKTTIVYTVNSGSPIFRFNYSGSTAQLVGSIVSYVCGKNDPTYNVIINIRSAAACDLSVSSVTAKEVLAPAATCAYIFKTVNGSQGWNMDGAFNLNGTSYTYNVYELGESKLLYAGGKATAAWGDPGVWCPAVTRALGKTMIVGPVTIVDTTAYCMVGFDSDAAGLLSQSFYINLDKLLTRDTTTNGPTVYTPLDNTIYYLAIRLLAEGAEYYIRTVTGPWKLLWRGGTNNTATLYPGLSNYSAAFTLGKPGVQIPAVPWNPPCLAYDSFTRADGAVGNSEALDSDGVSAPVRPWSAGSVSSNGLVVTPELGSELATGNLTVGTWYSITATESNHFFTGCAVGNTFRATATTGLDASNKVKAITFASTGSLASVGTADVAISGVGAAFTAGTQSGFALGVDDPANPQNGIFVYKDGTKIYLDVLVAGAWTNKIAETKTHVATRMPIIYRTGTEIRVYYRKSDDTVEELVGAFVTLDATQNAATRGPYAGFFSTYVGNKLDEIRISPTGTGNEFASLDRYLRG